MFATKARMGRIVARRELTDASDPKRRIIASVGTPRRMRSGDWQCVVRIDGLGPHPIFEFGGGVDSLQALLVGIGVLRNALKQAPCCLAWRGDSVLHLAGGIPRQTPSEFGEEFERRLEQFVLREQRRTRKFRVKIIRAQMAAEAAEKAASCLRTSSKRRQRRSD